jgi:outer membrane lipoprotein-sorting protein
MNSAVPIRILFRMLGAFWLTFAMLQPAAFAAGWDLDQLMQSLAKIKSGRASFVEKKTIAMLDRPVESSGELLYTAPDRLEKRTVKPKPETMLVQGGTMTFERGTQKHVMQLSEYPELAGLIDSIRGTLAGDRRALERSFKLKLEGGAERWTLTLMPTDAKLARSVHLILISGVRDHVATVDVTQTDGDRTLMTIERIASQ